MSKVSGSSRKFVLSPNLKVGVLLGGTSPEREVSLKSGKAVEEALQAAGVETRLIDPARFKKNRCDFSGIDAAFVALHGEGGEDGTIQRQLERSGLPYTGSTAVGCSLSINKNRAKALFRKAGIPTPDSRLITLKNWRKTLKSFPAPFFVKPPEDGSSLGIFLVESVDGDQAKIHSALKKYGRLLVEKRIAGREFTVGVLGMKALPVVELKPKGAFYDFHSKYTKGMCEYLVPAPISPKLTRKLQRLGVAVHKTLQLRDFSRTDIMVDESGSPYVLEANAIPGFTALSLVPKAAACAGISFEELCTRLLTWALKRGPEKVRSGSRNRKRRP